MSINISKARGRNDNLANLGSSFVLICTSTHRPLHPNYDTGLKSQKSAKTNTAIINSRAIFPVISHRQLLTHPRLSLCVSSSWALLDFIFSLGILPLRFRFFFSFKHLPSAFCFLPNKQPESSEPEGCSSPTSLNTAKRKRQKEERTHFRKAMPRSEKGMSLLCGEERTHRLQPVWVGMGWGASLLHPCTHPRVNTVSFPPAWHHYPETLKSKILLPCYLCHPKPFANWKSGLWHTQSKFTQSKFNN